MKKNTDKDMQRIMAAVCCDTLEKKAKKEKRAGVGDFPGFSQKLILISSFSSDIEWGWVPKNSQPPGEVNTKNYQNDFLRG